MNNTDKVVEYILTNTKDLPATKIKALADVVKALGGEVTQEPNVMKEEEDPNLIDETQPLDLSKIDNMEIDGNKTPIKIYN